MSKIILVSAVVTTFCTLIVVLKHESHANAARLASDSTWTCASKPCEMQTTCGVVRVHKPEEKRVVFVLRCPGSRDFGVSDVAEELYDRGGVMMMQFDNYNEKEK